MEKIVTEERILVKIKSTHANFRKAVDNGKKSGDTRADFRKAVDIGKKSGGRFVAFYILQLILK